MKKNKKNLLEGTISVTSMGAGYVSVDEIDEDIYIPPQFLNTAFNKDIVEVAMFPKVEGEKVSGEVMGIISRNKIKFVGTVKKEKNDSFVFITTDDHKIHVPIFIPTTDDNIKNNMKVLVEIIKWDNPRKNPIGKIIRIIGKKGDNDTEMESIVIEKGFEIEFPEGIEKEAIKIKEKSKSICKDDKNRRDFRDVLTFTIDPVDAKDFDDAISFKRISDDLFEIGVHIADVSYWVREKSSIDKEAKKRGFSIYLVDRTIPMLPEILSNDVCSLNPNEDKLTFSAVFTISKGGEVKNTWFGRTIINSDKRFTYEEAQEIIDGKNGPYAEEIREIMAITRNIRKKRVEAGSLEFSYDEVQVEIDKKGKPINIYTKKGIESQKLIEELMVLANREVALYIGGKKSKGLCIYRIHENPDKDSLDNLFSFLKKLGYNIRLSGNAVSSKELNELLLDLKDKDEEFLVKTLVIRSLPKAIYSIKNKRHFAMALPHYAHFTSPIRRYADLLNHRSLQAKLDNIPPSSEDRDLYKEVAGKLSQIEVDLESAERTSLSLKQTEYMLGKIGETRSGIISGVTQWGIYVQDIKSKSEGMIRLRSMKDDFYTFDKENFAIIGSRTKKKYSLGQRVKIKIIGGDIERRTIDYSFV